MKNRSERKSFAPFLDKSFIKSNYLQDKETTITLQQLKYVIRIVEFRSMTQAAANLYISQPALSNTIKDLEKELNIEIFTRNTKGISLTTEGAEFLSYARQVVEQADLLEMRYTNKKPSRLLCSISTQHYVFAVKAFCNLLQKTSSDEYEYTLRETRTSEIIDDVKNMKSEIGLLYLNDFNQKVITKLLNENHLIFTPLFKAEPHVFISSACPLAKKETLTLEDLEDYPYLSYEQGDINSFYFSEEMQSTVSHKKSIHVSDRATMLGLIVGINGYTICSGVSSSDLVQKEIKSIPLKVADSMIIGYIKNERTVLSGAAENYIDELKLLLSTYGMKLL